MGTPETVVLSIFSILFWALIIGIPVMLFRRIGDLGLRITKLESEIRRLVEQSARS